MFYRQFLNKVGMCIMLHIPKTLKRLGRAIIPPPLDYFRREIRTASFLATPLPDFFSFKSCASFDIKLMKTGHIVNNDNNKTENF